MAVKREWSPIPTTDEVVQDLKQSKFFSKLDHVLELAHEGGHPGIMAIKQRLRSKVWWPGIDKAAEKICKTCRGC